MTYSDANQVAQVQKFFQASLQSEVIMDLLPQNFMVDENGVVHLIDFVEKPKGGLQIFIRHAIGQWCQRLHKEGYAVDQARAILNDFTEGRLMDFVEEKITDTYLFNPVAFF